MHLKCKIKIPQRSEIENNRVAKKKAHLQNSQDSYSPTSKVPYNEAKITLTPELVLIWNSKKWSQLPTHRASKVVQVITNPRSKPDHMLLDKE